MDTCVRILITPLQSCRSLDGPHSAASHENEKVVDKFCGGCRRQHHSRGTPNDPGRRAKSHGRGHQPTGGERLPLRIYPDEAMLQEDTDQSRLVNALHYIV